MRGNFRLRPEEVLEIRRLREKGWRQVDLAAKFGVSQPQISDICNRHAWKTDLLRAALANSAPTPSNESPISLTESAMSSVTKPLDTEKTEVP